MAKAKEIISEYANGKTMGFAFSAFSSASTYSSMRDQGEGFSTSVAAGIKDFVLPELLGGYGYLAYAVVPGLASLGVDMYERTNTMIRQSQHSNQTPFSSYTFGDNESLRQMRMSGLALAEQAQSRNSTRIMGQDGQMRETAFGNEAHYLHR